MSSAIRVEKNFNLNKMDFNLSKQINWAVDLIARDIESGIDRGGQFGKRFKPNAKSTERKKGFNHPLKDTGLMKDQKQMVKVDATKGSPTGKLMPNEKRIDIGFYNQAGTNTIPSRPWFGISSTAERKIMKEMENQINRRIDRL
jgi:hypothetical protein|tara:strand:- start:534 stop:965 length:432 start_codon:yes stop_codon:yes gene_type:complete